MKKMVLVSVLAATGIFFAGCGNDDDAKKANANNENSKVKSVEYWENLANTLPYEEFETKYRDMCQKLRWDKKERFPADLVESCKNAEGIVDKKTKEHMKLN